MSAQIQERTEFLDAMKAVGKGAEYETQVRSLDTLCWGMGTAWRRAQTGQGEAYAQCEACTHTWHGPAGDLIISRTRCCMGPAACVPAMPGQWAGGLAGVCRPHRTLNLSFFVPGCTSSPHSILLQIRAEIHQRMTQLSKYGVDVSAGAPKAPPLRAPLPPWQQRKPGGQ